MPYILMKEFRENSDQHFEIIHKRLGKQEAMTKDNGAHLANLEVITKDNSARLANLEAGQQRQEQMLREILDRLPPKQ